ncbi:uncharacterized protein THITE_113983 [Thermothielavioides terrestris NRRL 8126]|uniref:Uncharacterized protein n=1 Tax=Thermothielavioides terrestris (strain ATCC 38088 / NRRL 8126) TaxID=578455 RepID=G2RC01_THETT|nr:uncharacterized protein THITE_113983 [Thermothielavioides terrestris NRRL 8126]AEO69322.1 hypothetical protein THITE_113983 [Thermothielavioides terrestris NRRL 8126]
MCLGLGRGSFPESQREGKSVARKLIPIRSFNALASLPLAPQQIGRSQQTAPGRRASGARYPQNYLSRPFPDKAGSAARKTAHKAGLPRPGEEDGIRDLPGDLRPNASGDNSIQPSHEGLKGE